MIDVLFEHRVVQNTGLAAETIWHAVHECYEAKGRAEGVTLPLVFLVLPLAFHQRTASALASRTQPGALYKALADDREITVGLQHRMQALADRTFQALSLGFSTKLFLLDEVPDLQLIPGRKTQPTTHVTDEVRTVFAAAKRIGQAFSEMTRVQLVTQLAVRF